MARGKRSAVTPVDEATGVNSIVVKEELKDTDEIEIISLIPNVSYYDKKTGDMYKWEKIGDSETMTFDTIKEMRRSSKAYFNQLWLKPLDERVIKHFKLERTYANYNDLTELSSYTATQIKDTCDKITKSPDGVKWTIFDRIKQFVVNDELTDIKVLRELERRFGIDLINLI